MRRFTGVFFLTYALVLSLTGLVGHAEQQPLLSGLIVTVYDNYTQENVYNNAPPLPPTTPIAGITTFTQVNQNFDSNPPFGLYDDFVIRYQGYIKAPTSGSYKLMPQGDDGTKIYVNEVLVQEDWYDKGSGGSESTPITFEAGVSQAFEMWFYENGGGAWVTLYWDIGNGWEIVPETAFEQSIVIETTTTTETPTTTTEPPTTTTEPPTTTTSPIRETTTTVVETTTTEVPVGTSTTVSPPETTVLQQAEQQETTTTTSEVRQTVKIIAGPSTDFKNMPAEAIQESINQIINTGLDSEEAQNLASNADVLNAVSAEQAQVIFDSIELSELSPEESSQIIEALAVAPESIKKEFENSIDIFQSGKFDSYVPVGSKITVSERRVIVAAAVGAALLAPTMSGGTPQQQGPSGGSQGPSPTGSEGKSNNQAQETKNRRRNVQKNR